MTTQRLPEKIIFSEEYSDGENGARKERETPADSVTTYVLPRLVESDLGIVRHRPHGEPGSLRGVELRDLSERPDDN